MYSIYCTLHSPNCSTPFNLIYIYIYIVYLRTYSQLVAVLYYICNVYVTSSYTKQYLVTIL